MLTLGIETSCDETAACVLKDEREVLSDVVYSQIADHIDYGGVVPEIASRKHISKIVPVINSALDNAGVTLSDIDLFAVTHRPGLIGALLVGLNTAKAMAYAMDKPVIGVNHIEAHFHSCFLQYPEIIFPCIGLIISGGHSHLFLCEDKATFRLLGQTRDDAAGESYDKVAKMLDLGYPGGPVIDKRAHDGNPEYVKFPRAWLEKESLDFSFSGLKTAVLVHLDGISEQEKREHTDDICASFQDAVTDVLVEKAIMAARQKSVNSIIVAGGVACNKGLNERFHRRCDEEKLNVFIPPPRLCTDNAVMVASAGYTRYMAGQRDDYTLEAVPYVEYNS